MSAHTQAILAVLSIERERQKLIWSPEHDLNHTDFEWLVIANKKMGKIADALLEDGDCTSELVKFGALLLGWLEMKDGCRD